MSRFAGHDVVVDVVTQNVDDLHERAGVKEVQHLHGSLFAPRCSACGQRCKFAGEPPEESAALYKIERQVKDFSPEDRQAIRQSSAKPLCQKLHAWLNLERQRVPEDGATTKAIDYSLNCWEALTTYLADGNVQIDNNHLENLIRPWAMGRRAWLFAGSELAGQRAAVIMSLLQSAKLHGHDPWAYLKDVLTRLPGHMNSRIDELLPHRWQAQS